MKKGEPLKLSVPRAAKRSHSIHLHGDTRIDEYYWMRLSDKQKFSKNPDPQTIEVLSYLEAENKYRESMLRSTDSLQEELYDEMVGRIKKDDQSVPYFENGYFYFRSFQKGQEFPVYQRRKDNLEGAEQTLLDVNKLAEGFNYYATGSLSVSPDNKILAFGEDTLSRRIYTLRFLYIESGKFLMDSIPNTNGYAVWSQDNKTIFYTIKDKSLRSFKVFRHILGEPNEKDVEIFHERDETFRTYIYKSKSRKYLVIGSASTLSNEYRILEAGDPFGDFRLFQSRKKELEYSITHFEDKWYILTNKDARNFKIMSCPESLTSVDNWIDFIPKRNDVLIESMEIFSDYFVITERVKGISQLRVISKNSKEEHYVTLPEEAHMVSTGKNTEYNTSVLRLHYSSMVSPASVYDYNMKEKTLCLLKQQEVLGGFSKDEYSSERLYVSAKDGKKIPVSIVYKKDALNKGPAPLLLYAYGAYGISMDPYFSSVRLSLLDRGFIFAIAHVRGGEELGRAWYEDGKLLNKKNTFTDFIDCAEYLIRKKYTDNSLLFAMGGSAGGLLMGAILNMRPDLWKGVIAAVPFVDALTTMMDDSIPLTTGEYDEWGNPADPKFYNYIKSYSPYDNVKKQDYPAILVTTGYHDSQVQYWEPAKWLAKLRDLKTNNEPLLLYCDLETGHGGAAGRFKRLKETALEYAFILWISGKV